ncbi:hypothetical protein [Rhizobium rhizogenes]|uniref:hypothetical protein n=1 Tax=Rhizobium rhizogenes TaxID=359 RepID=UPI0028688D1C|nr:hypothetical protein [Rhizobium rhizogenes]
MDRLARSHFQLIIATLKAKGANLFASEQPLVTSTAAGVWSYLICSVSLQNFASGRAGKARLPWGVDH